MRIRNKAVRLNLCHLSLLLCALPSLMPAATLNVAIQSVDPEPTWLNEKTVFCAVAAMTVKKKKQEYLGDTTCVLYRWQWRFIPPGSVSGMEPSQDPASPGWTEWAADPTAKVSATFSTPGIRQVAVMVEARMVNVKSVSQHDRVTAETATLLHVVDLEDVHNLRVVTVKHDRVVMAWEPAANPNVAGYAYYIDPYRDDVYDAGKQTCITIRKLKPETEYSVGVFTYDTQGNTTRTSER